MLTLIFCLNLRPWRIFFGESQEFAAFPCLLTIQVKTIPENKWYSSLTINNTKKFLSVFLVELKRIHPVKVFNSKEVEDVWRNNQLISYGSWSLCLIWLFSICNCTKIIKDNACASSSDAFAKIGAISPILT